MNEVRSRVRPAMSHLTSFPGTYLFFQTLEYQVKESTVHAESFIRNDKAINENSENDPLHSH